MARFQDVRGKLEITTRDALIAAGIERVVFDNTEETPPRLPYAIVTVSFGRTIEPSLGCVADHLQGSMAVGVYSRLGRGSTEAEDAVQSVLWAWGGLNKDFSDPVRLRTYNHDGPVTFDPGGLSQLVRGLGTAPSSIHTVNCGFTARVAAAPPLQPGEKRRLATDTGVLILAAIEVV